MIIRGCCGVISRQSQLRYDFAHEVLSAQDAAVGIERVLATQGVKHYAPSGMHRVFHIWHDPPAGKLHVEVQMD